MNLKRWTGILLICAAAFMALALFVMWGLPVLFPPEDLEDSLPQATVLPTASPAASTEENDLPVLEDSVNLFVINEDHPADADFAPEETAEFDSVTVDARIVPALSALCDAAKADGVTLKFSGGYVSYAEQEAPYRGRFHQNYGARRRKIHRVRARHKRPAKRPVRHRAGRPRNVFDNGYLRLAAKKHGALRLCVPLSCRKRGRNRP